MARRPSKTASPRAHRNTAHPTSKVVETTAAKQRLVAKHPVLGAGYAPATGGDTFTYDLSVLSQRERIKAEKTATFSAHLLNKLSAAHPTIKTISTNPEAFAPLVLKALDIAAGWTGVEPTLAEDVYRAAAEQIAPKTEPQSDSALAVDEI